jgi:predicted SprT family Zn-dependent metalloprotease
MKDYEYLNTVAQQCLYDLSYLRIPYGNIKGFTINTMATRRWGQCRKRPDGYHININKCLCDGKHETGLKATLIHEILHTCEGCMNHGPRWKHWAQIVHEHTGLIIQRTDSAQNKGFSTETYSVKRMPIKYQLMCKRCGYSTYYCRRTKVVQRYKDYRCGKCGGELELIERR